MSAYCLVIISDNNSNDCNFCKFKLWSVLLAFYCVWLSTSRTECCGWGLRLECNEVNTWSNRLSNVRWLTGCTAQCTRGRGGERGERRRVAVLHVHNVIVRRTSVERRDERHLATVSDCHQELWLKIRGGFALNWPCLLEKRRRVLQSEQNTIYEAGLQRFQLCTIPDAR